MSLRRVMMLLFAVCGAPLTMACGGGDTPLPLAPPVPQGVNVASDGQRFDGSDGESRALRASGAHDLACPAAEITLQRMFDQNGKRKLVVDGCGKRALYFWSPVQTAPFTFEYTAVLEGIVELRPPGS